MGYQHSHHHKSNCQKASLARPQIWDLYVWPIYQHSHHHKSSRQKASPATPRFGTSMYDPYTSTHIIIRVTAKKRHLLTPRFGTCMYDPSNTTTTTSKSLRVSTAPNRKNGKQGSLCNVLRPSRRLLRPGDLLHRGQPVLSQPGLLQLRF